MIWYLLYPLRGTTEAPVLAPTHPLRKAFSRYGTWAARHVETVLPLSVASIFLLLYPFFFLYTTDATNITSGVSNLPHHVWTDARPLGEAIIEPDVIMRSIWVHGSYMKALERDVLLGALELQDELLGPTTDFNPRRPKATRPPPSPLKDLDRDERDAYHIINGLTPQSWFFHSPLQYWSGSVDNISNDRDIISTVNARKRQSTSVNVTLRHSIVFSGKRFEERRLVAADALVITLIHLRDSPVGQQWVRKLEALANKLRDKWTIIPEDGRSTSSRLYEFQFRPMSWYDWIILTIAYSLTLLYLLFSLSKLRAVKSRLGLMITILAQIVASIGSSFTVCAIFKIDLSRVPSYAYPLVVLAISMENSLRLINTVIMTSSTISIGSRIGEAFGATAHTAVANRVQNLLILFGLSRITVPGVAAFCTFAAVATIFDFFYMATFFLAVLSVDVRQKELIELEKASVKRHKGAYNGHISNGWVDVLRRIRLGEVTLSTRVAGTIVVLGFVLIAQSHYAPESRLQWLHWIATLRSADIVPPPRSSLLVDIHQARSPTSWLRLQDHETAREVIKVVKPLAHSYVARVFEPVVFVLKGSNRTPGSGEPYFLPAVYDFVNHEIPRFVVVLLTVVATLRIFTKYLLGDELTGPGGPDHPDDEPLLSVKTLSRAHTLDVMSLAASPAGHLVSVGLDRVVQIWDIPSRSSSQVISQPNSYTASPFPVWGMAIDDESRWLAFVSSDKVMLWDIEQQSWNSSMQVDVGPHKPEAVFFTPDRANTIPSLVVVKRDGTMVEVETEVPESKKFTICKTPLTWAVAFAESSPSTQFTSQQSILTASKKNCIHLVRRCGDSWVSTEVKLSERAAKDVHSLIPLPAFSAYLIGRSEAVDLVDIASGDIVHTFWTEAMRRGSLRHTLSCQTAQSGLTSLILSYVNSQTGDLVIHTYLPKDDNDTIYSYNPSEPLRRLWGETKEITRRIVNPGKWETLANGRIVGVRQRVPHKPKEPEPPSSLMASATSSSGLRRRSSVMSDRLTGPTRNLRNTVPENDVWEAWVMDHLNSPDQLDPEVSMESIPLNPPPGGALVDGIAIQSNGSPHHENLMISELGPLVKLGTSSVAVGFGNLVKIISVGHEHFDQPSPRSNNRLARKDHVRNFGAGSRRKKEKDRTVANGGSGSNGSAGYNGLAGGPANGYGTGGGGVGGGLGLGTENGVAGRGRGESLSSIYGDWEWGQER
ncbi:Sterol-sensing domain of SREBP cleavage-activation domain containing protein [Rhypophila decipiens]